MNLLIFGAGAFVGTLFGMFVMAALALAARADHGRPVPGATEDFQ